MFSPRFKLQMENEVSNATFFRLTTMPKDVNNNFRNAERKLL